MTHAPDDLPPPVSQLISHSGGTIQTTAWRGEDPPVVLITGLGVPAITWFEVPDAGMLEAVMTAPPWNGRPLVAPALAQCARVICYDRAGLGDSSPPTQGRGLDAFLAELDAVLTAQVAGPAVLVGHSMGGLIAHAYALRSPDQVVGLVLIDSAHPDQGARLAATLSAAQQQAEQDDLALMLADHPERPDLAAMLRQGRDALRPGALGQLPLAVLSRGVAVPFDRAAQGIPGLTRSQWQARTQVWAGLQAEYLRSSTQARQVSASHSGHYIQFDQPELVIEAVRQIWLAAGGTSPAA